MKTIIVTLCNLDRPSKSRLHYQIVKTVNIVCMEINMFRFLLALFHDIINFVVTFPLL